MGNPGTGDVELGDARRTWRLNRLVADLAARPTGSIPVASGGWAEAKAAYRLLDNPAMEWREICYARSVHFFRAIFWGVCDHAPISALANVS